MSICQLEAIIILRKASGQYFALIIAIKMMKRIVTQSVKVAARSHSSVAPKSFLGLDVSVNEKYQDVFAKHRQFVPVGDKAPYVAQDCFVAPNATVTGRVGMLEASSVWYGAVIRGDQTNMIRLGFLSNVQDNVVINCANKDSLNSGFPPDVMIGKCCTINQGAVLTSCFIGDVCVIGQGAIVPEGCVVEYGSMVADGAVLAPYTQVPSKQLWAGNPAKFVRDIEDDELTEWTRVSWQLSLY